MVQRLVTEEGIAGAIAKAGCNGGWQTQAITNEVQLLCRRDRFLSAT